MGQPGVFGASQAGPRSGAPGHQGNLVKASQEGLSTGVGRGGGGVWGGGKGLGEGGGTVEPVYGGMEGGGR